MKTPDTAIAEQCTTGREALFEELYLSAFPSVARFVSKMNGSFDDAKDIFQDALVIYYEKAQEPGFTIRITPQAYILGTARHLWTRKYNSTHNTLALDHEADIADSHTPGINTRRLLHLLETSGRKCMDLLRAFYYDKLPVKHISLQLGYSSEHSAAVQKYKCLEKVRDTVKEKSIAYEAFID